MMKRKTIVCKIPKYDSVGTSDRLSELPECLIVQILSLLPIEEAVRTGVLSARWKNLWNYTDKIVFNYVTYKTRPPPEKQIQFISFVEHTLTQCVCPKTISLRTNNLHGDHFSRKDIDKWFQLVSSRKVESLTLEIWISDYAPPECFYHNSNLVKLHIIYLNLIIPGPLVVTWTSLKSLSLREITIGDEQIAKILSGCHVLEDLNLHSLDGFKSLNITSPRLVKLSMVTLPDLIEINAPSSLQLLNLSGLFFSLVRFTNSSSLVHANLTFDSDDDDVATKVLESLHNVQELTIGKEVIAALSMRKSSKPFPLFFKCKRLKFITSAYKHDLRGITDLLKSSHHMETLVIDVPQYFEDEEERHEFLNGRICDFEGTSLYLNMESRDFLHLKTIEVAYCNWCTDKDEPGIRYGEFFIFELVACILRKAPALDKLVITPQQELCKICLRNCAREDASELSRKLLQFFLDREGLGEWKLTKKKNCFEIVS